MVSNKQVRRALFSAITGESDITSLLADPAGVYHRVAPEGAERPFVIFNKNPGAQPTYTFADTAWTEQTWLVKAVDDGDTSDTAEDIAAALDELLTRAEFPITGGALLDCRRMSDVDYPENADGRTYVHHGALYRLTVQG